MGFKSRPKRPEWYRERIRDLNSKILEAKDAALKDRVIEVKDQLIDEMMEACEHDRLIEARGKRKPHPMDPFSGRAIRFCLSCGAMEFKWGKSWKALVGQARQVSRREHAVMRGRTLRRLGIDL